MNVWPAAHFMFITMKTKVKVTDKNLQRGTLTNPKWQQTRATILLKRLTKVGQPSVHVGVCVCVWERKHKLSLKQWATLGPTCLVLCLQSLNWWRKKENKKPSIKAAPLPGRRHESAYVVKTRRKSSRTKVCCFHSRLLEVVELHWRLQTKSLYYCIHMGGKYVFWKCCELQTSAVCLICASAGSQTGSERREWNWVVRQAGSLVCCLVVGLLAVGWAGPTERAAKRWDPPNKRLERSVFVSVSMRLPSLFFLRCRSSRCPTCPPHPPHT